MTTGLDKDHYETLQISKNADQETVQRVFRLLAQRFHPDNLETGDEARFREIHEAFIVLNVRYDTFKQERWRFIAAGPAGETDFGIEQQLRFMTLEILYSHRRNDPYKPGLSQLDLAEMLGRPREHLEFTLWYLAQKKFVTRGDQSSLVITAEGIDFVEQHAPEKRRHLRITGRTSSVARGHDPVASGQ
jgi:curved DNA-binding protein CbpA